MTCFKAMYSLYADIFLLIGILLLLILFSLISYLVISVCCPDEPVSKREDRIELTVEHHVATTTSIKNSKASGEQQAADESIGCNGHPKGQPLERADQVVETTL